MKTLKELRDNKPKFITAGSEWGFLKTKKDEIDFNVYMPTKNKNLQRDLVWKLHQKQELIWSILLERNIPHLCLIPTEQYYYQVIDGKQRLSTVFDFLDNKFTINIEDAEYFYNELPNSYKMAIERGYVRFYTIPNDVVFTDEDKINCFKYINFSGTSQDLEFMNNL